MPGIWSTQNSEKNPDLTLAMKYDSEMNGGDRSIASQSLAEHHYLKYLDQAKDSAQRARVYVQLGVLFSTNWHRDKGEKPDYEKARRYFSLALQEEKERVDRAMLRARLGMVTPQQSPEERLDIRIKNYRWLIGLDEKELKRNWLPEAPQKEPTDRQVRVLSDLLRKVAVAEAGNIVHDACLTSDPLKSLNKAIRALSGTEAASAAQRRLDQWRAKVEKDAFSGRLEELGQPIQVPASRAASADGGLSGATGDTAPGAQLGRSGVSKIAVARTSHWGVAVAAVALAIGVALWWRFGPWQKRCTQR